MKSAGPSAIQRSAIRVIQTSKNPLFLFALTAGELLRVADIFRVSRDSAGRLFGYQRPEVKGHVQSITEYLDGDEVLFPNSITLVLSFRVNNTKPLPAELITELLPEVSTQLPPGMAARRVPSALCDLLNRDPESPFRMLIRRSSMDATSRRSAVVTDTSVVKMIQGSLSGLTGCLFPFRNIASGETDIASIKKVLLTFWTAVRNTFPRAWGLPPSRSRLMHGAGISAMGRLMDKVMGNIDIHSARAPQTVRTELLRIRPVCRWTEGDWDELGLAWNQVQSTPQHIKLISNVLLRAYTSNRRTAA